MVIQNGYYLILSLDLRQILPPKLPFYIRPKMQISSKILPQIPNFCNFIQNKYFCDDGQFWSFFRQKRNSL